MSNATRNAKKARTGTLSWLGDLLHDPDLDPTEALLMIGLADHADEHDECFVGIETLARYARVSYGTARRRLTDLEARGRLERTRRRRDDGNLSTYTWRLIRPEPARNMRDDHRAPESAMTSARPDARAELPSVEPPSREEPLAPSALAVVPEPGMDLANDVASMRAGSPEKAAALRLTERAYARPRKPIPRNGRKREITNLLASAIGSGYSEAELAAVIDADAISAWTGGAIQYALTNHRPAAPDVDAGWDRNAPSGPIDPWAHHPPDDRETTAELMDFTL